MTSMRKWIIKVTSINIKNCCLKKTKKKQKKMNFLFKSQFHDFIFSLKYKLCRILWVLFHVMNMNGDSSKMSKSTPKV